MSRGACAVRERHYRWFFVPACRVQCWFGDSTAAVGGDDDDGGAGAGDVDTTEVDDGGNDGGGGGDDDGDADHGDNDDAGDEDGIGEIRPRNSRAGGAAMYVSRFVVAVVAMVLVVMLALAVSMWRVFPFPCTRLCVVHGLTDFLRACPVASERGTH